MTNLDLKKFINKNVIKEGKIKRIINNNKWMKKHYPEYLDLIIKTTSFLSKSSKIGAVIKHSR